MTIGISISVIPLFRYACVGAHIEGVGGGAVDECSAVDVDIVGVFSGDELSCADASRAGGKMKVLLPNAHGVFPRVPLPVPPSRT